MKLDKFTVKAQEALQESQAIARKRDHQEILPEHLFAALLQQQDGQLKPAAARAMIPRLQKRLGRIAGRHLGYPPAETLRLRLIQKDRDKLFTFLAQKGVAPTNNQAERSILPHVIMRKICNGTRSPEGSLSHAVLPSLLQTARRQGKEGISLLFTLLTGTAEAARGALFASGP